MQDIMLNVTDEEQLYNSLDPRRNLLRDDVKAYLLNEIQREGRLDDINLVVSSSVALDEARFADGFHRWIEDEELSIKRTHRKNGIQQLWMFGAGVLFITLSLMLQSMVGVVWFTVLSTIGAFSMWEAASISIVQNPKLRMQRRAVMRMKKGLTLSFQHASAG